MYVGMNLQYGIIPEDIEGVPHVRGDEPQTEPIIHQTVTRSPCTWG